MIGCVNVDMKPAAFIDLGAGIFKSPDKAVPPKAEQRTLEKCPCREQRQRVEIYYYCLYRASLLSRFFSFFI